MPFREGNMKALTSLTLILLSAWMFVPAAFAGDDAALDTALDLMAADEYAGAALVVKDILREAPGDGEVWYFLGRAYNRMNRFARASDALVRAGIHGFEGPDLEREMGIALLGRGHERKALLSLRRARPDDAEAAYFRGMAASRLGLEVEAARSFDIAASNPEFEDRVSRFRSSAPVPKDRERPWEVSINVGMDYNDNVTLSPDVTPFPGGAEPEGDFQLNLSATGAYTFFQGRDAKAGAGQSPGGPRRPLPPPQPEAEPCLSLILYGASEDVFSPGPEPALTKCRGRGI